MRAITVSPGAPNAARLDDVAAPAVAAGAIPVRRPAPARGADPAGLSGLVTRRVPVARRAAALVRQPGDLKVVVDFTV